MSEPRAAPSSPSGGTELGCVASRVVVIVPNWNRKGYLEACLRSLLAQDFTDHTVILVDNGSRDGSLEYVQREFPQVRVIANETNLGFAKANNQALVASRSEFVATLNNDAWADPKWLGELVRAMEAHPQVGMCASKMLLADQAEIVDSAGIAVDRVGIAWGLDGGASDDGLPCAPVPAFSPCAGAALYRRAMLDEIGLFDEDFFAYLEDVDLAWRAQWAGWQCLIVPSAVVYHAHSATSREGYLTRKSRLLGRNKAWMVCKNFPFPALLWYAPLILAYDLMALGYALTTGYGFSALQGRIEAIGAIPRMLAKRRALIRRISPRAMLARLSPIENPLAVLHRYRHLLFPPPGRGGRADQRGAVRSG
jgi:GT2 family glycosyltransferase